jgi:basic amino acid/polyamine antiporter, APA family
METPGTERPPARLGLWDTASIIVAIIIGVGIFKTPANVLQNVAGPWEAMGVWVLGGLLAFGGALCFAELASTYPRSGGEYVYLTRAYGSAVGFLFGWAQMAVLRTGGSIAVVAYVFADYAGRLLDIDARAPEARFLYAFLAIAPIVVLSVVNLLGVTFGKLTQNLLTVTKVLGLGAVLVVGLFWPHDAHPGGETQVIQGRVVRAENGCLAIQEEGNGSEHAFSLAPQARVTIDGNEKSPAGAMYGERDLKAGCHVKVLVSASEPAVAVRVKARESSRLAGFALAMIFVLWTYAGWHEGAYVAAEVRRPRRNLPLALMLGTAGVMVLYVLLNAAYLVGLGFENAEDSQAIAADVLALALGKDAGRAMSLLVAISALGAINAVIITGSRIYAEVASDHRLFAPLARWNPRWGTPARALVVQGLGSIAIIGVVGMGWQGQDGFDTLVTITAPVEYLFFLLTAMALIVLRIKDRGIEHPFAVPAYPWTPLFFCTWCAFMLYGSIVYAGTQAVFGLALLLVGVPLYYLSRALGTNPRPPSPRPPPPASGTELETGFRTGR